MKREKQILGNVKIDCKTNFTISFIEENKEIIQN